ncbi:hypothetical protein [Aquipseudomonas guryensis]|jgi:hypothetical protein|uniref:Uncharacterized protein n=1 Tax=Aquipseudomonas guryensis TaxID=2759165 RepID=A0A7W4H3X0_9GAMM|nr:hypothetical protein [Pseudomonas guryensis]MBB1519909.1 hypothetical protein [Pseudomonas guryensis]
MKALALNSIVFLTLSGLVSYFLEASFAIAPGVVAVAYLIGLIVSLGSTLCSEFCINVAMLISTIIMLVIVSHFFPSITEVGLYNVHKL